MTAHELARLLLAGPDVLVTIWEDRCGDDDLCEIMSAILEFDEVRSSFIILRGYIPD